MRGSIVGRFTQRTWKMEDFSQRAKYFYLIQHQVPGVLRQEKTKIEGRGNARTDHDIKVIPLFSIRGDCFAGSMLMSVVTSSIFPSRNACGLRVATSITQFWTEVDTIWASWSADMVSTGSFWITTWINSEEVCNTLSLDTVQTRFSNDAAFRRIRALAGAMSMIDLGMESLPMAEIFIPLEDEACAGFKIRPPLREFNNLSVG